MSGPPNVVETHSPPNYVEQYYPESATPSGGNSSASNSSVSPPSALRAIPQGDPISPSMFTTKMMEGEKRSEEEVKENMKKYKGSLIPMNTEEKNFVTVLNLIVDTHIKINKTVNSPEIYEMFPLLLFLKTTGGKITEAARKDLNEFGNKYLSARKAGSSAAEGGARRMRSSRKSRSGRKTKSRKSHRRR